MNNKFDLKELIDNTINRYLDDLKEFKRRYELNEDANLIHSEKRYKNYLLLNKIKEKNIPTIIELCEEVMKRKKKLLNQILYILIYVF